MARGNGGIIGRKNLTTFGGNNEAKFTSNGTWSPCGPSSGTKFIDVVIVAGGGGGGGSIGAPKNGGSGGGGAGGMLFLECYPYTPPQGNKSVTIGGGGAGNAGASASGGNGVNGSNSVWGCFTATAGGGGGGGDPSAFLAGSDGGSGGGGMGGGGTNAKPGGSSTQSAVPGFANSQNSNKGNAGGTGNGGPVSGTPGDCRTGGGGGGAAAAGPFGSIDNAGGAGFGPLESRFPASAPFGDSNVLAGGGGGGQYSPGIEPSIPTTRPAGGVGGGGDGAVGSQGFPCAPVPIANLAKGSNADDNTGGGGGGGAKITFIPCTPYDRGADNSGADGRAGGNGGSGIVLVNEKNKASGVWNLRTHMRILQQGTWPT